MYSVVGGNVVIPVTFESTFTLAEISVEMSDDEITRKFL